MLQADVVAFVVAAVEPQVAEVFSELPLTNTVAALASAGYASAPYR